MRLYLIFLICFPLLVLSQNESILNKKELPNDVRWFTQSHEYISLCNQIYDIAYKSLQDKLHREKNSIIVMDLDETVLDNSEYQIELFFTNSTYNEKSWNNWVNKEEADLIPGAKKFILSYKKNKNARIIYISNRSAQTLKATKSNMKKLGLYFEDDIFLLRENKLDSKIIRRSEVLNGTNRMELYGPQKIIAYFGDAMGDFPKNDEYHFSENKFIFPNPMYGKW